MDKTTYLAAKQAIFDGPPDETYALIRSYNDGPMAAAVDAFRKGDAEALLKNLRQTALEREWDDMRSELAKQQGYAPGWNNDA